MKPYLLFIFLSIFTINGAYAQEANASSATLITVTYAGQLPGGDLKNDFGANFNVGMNLQYMTKNKLLFGIEANYIFGKQINNDVLSMIRTPDGNIIGKNKEYGYVAMDERGAYIGLQVGKILPVLAKNKNSGLRITVSGGFLQHKIRLDDETGELPQLAGEYIKGYDRLTNGFALTEFIGYQYLSSNRLINFYIGLEFTQGFTKNRRSWDIPTMSVLDESRLDLLNGLRVGWVLPIYQVDNPGEVFY